MSGERLQDHWSSGLFMSGFYFEYLYVLMLLLPILRPQSESSSFLMKMLAFNINAVFLNFRCTGHQISTKMPFLLGLSVSTSA